MEIYEMTMQSLCVWNSIVAIVYLFTGSDTILWNIPRWKNLMTIMEASKLISIGLNCGPQNISTLQT